MSKFRIGDWVDGEFIVMDYQEGSLPYLVNIDRFGGQAWLSRLQIVTMNGRDFNIGDTIQALPHQILGNQDSSTKVIEGRTYHLTNYSLWMRRVGEGKFGLHVKNIHNSDFKLCEQGVISRVCGEYAIHVQDIIKANKKAK
jgi:hypothetical protein